MSLHLVDHALVRDRLARIRSVQSDTASFRRAVHDIARLMCAEVTRDLETRECEVETPLGTAAAQLLARPVVLVPILRAGVGLLHGFTEILTEASIGYIGLFRDEETHRPTSYYCKLPSTVPDADVILVDPMLATGGSAADAADELKRAGATRIRFACLIAAPEGVEAFTARHPDVPIFAAAQDERLDDNAFIVPGLGDAGDRYFGT